jgi:hypothetical protein
MGEFIVWNKGKTIENDERVKQYTESRILKTSSKEWKETKGKEKIEKCAKTKSDPIWIETIGKPTNKKRIETLKRNGNVSGGKNPRAKKVINLDTEQIFNYVDEAAKFYYEPRHYIDKCCKGKRKICLKGFHWKYLDEYNK